MILIITNKEDTYPVPVIEKLREWDVPFLRLNTEALLTDYEFAWWARGGACDFRLRNLAAGVECLVTIRNRPTMTGVFCRVTLGSVTFSVSEVC